MEQTLVRRPHFFFTTAPTPCPYLKDRMERKVVTELSGANADRLNDNLSRAGFRRSHAIAYTPACSGCTACVPVRIIAAAFTQHRTFRKIYRKNADLTPAHVPVTATEEHFDLFERYQKSRHGDGDMANMGFYDYRSMVEDSPVRTFITEYRLPDETLVAACLTDQLSDGLSAVYSFYDPELGERSLGTYMVLWMIEETLRRGLPFVYLGYWIAESRKMAYKSRFTPLERFGPGGWTPLRVTDQS